MLERLIVSFAAWFVRPLGYEVVQDETMDRLRRVETFMFLKWLNGDLDLSIPEEKHDNVIKVDFKT